MRVFSREAVRELDRLAVEEFGIPSIVLMENAARALAAAAMGLRRVRAGAGVVVVCGAGNNGGDGLAAARHLSNAGVPVAIALAAGDGRFSGDAATNLRIVRAMNVPILEIGGSDAAGSVRRAAEAIGGSKGLVIDALFGTGLVQAVRPPFDAVIAAINELGRSAFVLAVDVPSGLDAETGEPLGPAHAPAVRADLTVTFVGPKRGFAALGAQPFIGRVRIADIGAPRMLAERLGDPLPAAGHPGERSARAEAAGSANGAGRRARAKRPRH